MKSGILSLWPLYKFLKLNHDKIGLYGKSPKGRGYGAEVAKICQDIAATQGFYLWGRYERNGLWRNIYLGKAGFGRTAHLRARIKEELKDERACIWYAFVSVRAMETAGERNYPRMWHHYKKHMHRALKKAGATHIVWVADPHLANSQVQNIESDLIETLSPSANMSRPVPPVSLQEHTKTIVGEFRELIHKGRKRFLMDKRDFLIPPIPQKICLDQGIVILKVTRILLQPQQAAGRSFLMLNRQISFYLVSVRKKCWLVSLAFVCDNA